jgi:hypothetical protein
VQRFVSAGGGKPSLSFRGPRNQVSTQRRGRHCRHSGSKPGQGGSGGVGQ